MISIIDACVLVIYLMIILYIGHRVSRTNKTQEDYFVAGRSIPWFPVALTIIATTISANGFIGGPGWAYTIGLSAFMLNISIPLVMFFVCTCFLPFLYNLKVISCYEYLEKRLGKESRTLCAIGFLCTALIQISSMIYIPSLFIQTITGIPLLAILPVLVTISVAYTIVGGVKAVIWTDVIQMFVLWGGMFAIIFIIASNFNIGMSEFLNQAHQAGKLDALNYSFDLSAENGVWASLLGGSILWGQYYATDQSQVQRMLAAKSLRGLKRSLLFGGIAMNIMYMIFMFIGIALFVYYQGRQFASSNDVMIYFIVNEIPPGLMGLIIAAIFAAAMSSIDAILNSMSTVFIKDIYEPWFRKNQLPTPMAVSMRFTLLIAIIVVIFTFIGFNGTVSAVLAIVGKYISYTCGSILATFFLAMFTRRANDRGVATGFVTGILLTALVGNLTTINWLWYNLVGFVASILIGYLLSYLTGQPPSTEQLNYTYRAQKMLIRQDSKQNASEIPGVFDRYAYYLLLFFAIQYLFLIMI